MRTFPENIYQVSDVENQIPHQESSKKPENIKNDKIKKLTIALSLLSGCIIAMMPEFIGAAPYSAEAILISVFVGSFVGAVAGKVIMDYGPSRKVAEEKKSSNKTFEKKYTSRSRDNVKIMPTIHEGIDPNETLGEAVDRVVFNDGEFPESESLKTTSYSNLVRTYSNDSLIPTNPI